MVDRTKIVCPICGNAGGIVPSRLCGLQFVCMTCGQKGRKARLPPEMVNW